MSPLNQLPAVAPRRTAVAWRSWVAAALDLLFPPFCAVCQRSLGAGRRDPLCGDCWQQVERLTPPWCRVCGIELGRFVSAGAPERAPAAAHRCGACRRRPPRFTYARAAAHYGDIVREAVHGLKFRGRRALARPLGDLMVEMGRASLAVPEPDLLVPVPLHPRRHRERGFNQALLLAERLGRGWGLPVRTDVLARTAFTAPQSELSAEARHSNVRGAFALRRPELVAGRHVVLVDDILTTGATASACAASLREGGATVVGVVTVARVA